MDEHKEKPKKIRLRKPTTYAVNVNPESKPSGIHEDYLVEKRNKKWKPPTSFFPEKKKYAVKDYKEIQTLDSLQTSNKRKKTVNIKPEAKKNIATIHVPRKINESCEIIKGIISEYVSGAIRSNHASRPSRTGTRPSRHHALNLVGKGRAHSAKQTGKEAVAKQRTVAAHRYIDIARDKHGTAAAELGRIPTA